MSIQFQRAMIFSVCSVFVGASTGHTGCDFTDGGLVYSASLEREVEQPEPSPQVSEPTDRTAQYDLGWKYDNGEGVPQDDAEAVKWYRRAAEQGLADAQVSLGQMYADGKGVLKDDTEAAK
jgi:TPR repeat protein